MRLLLDTHILIWLMDADPRLNADGRKTIADADQVFASSASIWEIAIKSKLGKLRLDAERLMVRLAEAGLGELPISNRHAVAVGRLPLLHKDPFDRLLLAQAITEPMRLLTADSRLSAYSELVVVV